jgi:hydrogenase maturation factor
MSALPFRETDEEEAMMPLRLFGSEEMTFCITCSDAADPMRVESIDRERWIARCVDVGGHHSDVMFDLVPDVRVGQEVLVHAGVALALSSAAHPRAP